MPKAKYGGMDVSEARRLKALEEENTKLKRLYADAMLDNAGLKELLAKNGDVRRQGEAVAQLRESLEVSERRACTMITADRSVVRYRSRRPDDAGLRGRLREPADQRRRFGYRCLRPHSAIGYMTPAAYAATLKPQRGTGAAPPRKLRTAARFYRRANAQFSTHDSSRRWMSGWGHVSRDLSE
jgi:hypothetical protein